jgi:hypothetical protein
MECLGTVTKGKTIGTSLSPSFHRSQRVQRGLCQLPHGQVPARADRHWGKAKTTSQNGRDADDSAWKEAGGVNHSQLQSLPKFLFSLRGRRIWGSSVSIVSE